MQSCSDYFNKKSSAVSEFYNRFPYPSDSIKEGLPVQADWRWSLDDIYSRFTGAAYFNRNADAFISILDAGCGTGISTKYLAHMNPLSKIFAIDISSSAIDLASKRIKGSKLSDNQRVHFKNISLLELPDKYLYDFINSIGVLQHLEDPLLGLKKLGMLLKKGGLMHISLYSDYGRWEAKRVRSALSSLGIPSGEEGLDLCKKLIEGLPDNNSLKRDYLERLPALSSSDIDFADFYLHPQETTFSLNTLFELVELAGLEFLGFADPEKWSLDRLLEGELLEKAQSFEIKKQWKLIEDLDPKISCFDFFLAKPPLQHYSWKDDEILLNAKGRLSPCLGGWRQGILVDQNEQRIEISIDSVQLLRAISNEPDKPLGSLHIGLDPILIASIARGLHRDNLLLLSPR